MQTYRVLLAGAVMLNATLTVVEIGLPRLEYSMGADPVTLMVGRSAGYTRVGLVTGAPVGRTAGPCLTSQPLEKLVPAAAQLVPSVVAHRVKVRLLRTASDLANCMADHKSVAALFTRVVAKMPVNAGSAMVASMPKMATVIINSIKVNPRNFPIAFAVLPERESWVSSSMSHPLPLQSFPGRHCCPA